MTLEEKIQNIFNGEYEYENVEYFNLPENTRDLIANAIVNQYLYKLKTDITYFYFYTDFIDFRINELLLDEKYEAVDLYKRILFQINLQHT
jgi:hypothetical protein